MMLISLMLTRDGALVFWGRRMGESNEKDIHILVIERWKLTRNLRGMVFKESVWRARAERQVQLLNKTYPRTRHNP